MTRTKQRRLYLLRDGFTLIELLVVIGIIMVLIAILLPTLARSRETANRTACLSNERQILNAIFMYAADHGGSLPGPALPCVNDPRLVNPQPGVVLDPGHPTWSQMDVWENQVNYSAHELSNTALLQNYLGGPTNWNIWQCPSATEMWDTAHTWWPPQPFIGYHLGYGYLVNNSGRWTSTYPAFLFGAPFGVVGESRPPQKLTAVMATTYVDPNGTNTNFGKSKFGKDPTKVWLISDLDGRNFHESAGSAGLGITSGFPDPITIELENSCLFQPVHCNGSQIPSTADPTCGLGRNYGYLDGHAAWVNYADWPVGPSVEAN